MTIKRVTILGERCSGTNFLENAITSNFDVHVTWDFGWKHFWGHHAYANSDDVLFVGIVRDPVEWMNSLFRTPYHLNPAMRKSVDAFLNNECWSLYDNKRLHGARYGTEIMQDRNIYAPQQRYKNIFECRATKLRFLVDDMPNKVAHYVLIKYEDLRDDFAHTLDRIKRAGDLKIKQHIAYPIKPLNYKKGKQLYIPNRHEPKIDRALIIKHTDFDRTYEERLGYNTFSST